MVAMGVRVEEWMGGGAGVSAIRMLRRRGWDNDGMGCDSRTRERGEEHTEHYGLLGRRDRFVYHSNRFLLLCWMF